MIQKIIVEIYNFQCMIMYGNIFKKLTFLAINKHLKISCFLSCFFFFCKLLMIFWFNKTEEFNAISH
jgi:hypothetical protein